MSQPLYYDKNDGLLCWKNDKGEYIPVKTNLALMPKSLKIENRVLKIFDYDADAWKSVPSVAVAIGQGDFELATVADLQLKQDKALQYPEFNSLLTAELDPGIYNILVRDLGEVSPPVDPTDPPIMEMSEEGNLLDATAIPSQVNNSAILLVSAKYPRVLISGKGIFNESDGIWKEQAGFTENYKSELQEQFESLKTTVEQTEVSTVTCDDAGNLTIITSKIGQADGVTTTLNIKGKDGVTPQLRIKDGYWQISYDGTSWTTLGKATGDNGQDGKDGADGEDGKDGQDGTDGKDGESSIGINIIPILNDVYLDPTTEANGVYSLLTEQTISFSISAMYGTASIPVNLVTGTIMGAGGDWNDSIFSVTTPNTDNTYSTGVKTYTLTADMGPHGTHTFNVPVNFILASQGYDLMASPNCIKRDADGNAENITFSVYGTVSGGGFSKNLGKLTEIELGGCNLQIGDSNSTGTLTDNNDGTWTYTPSKDDKLLEVKLIKDFDVVDLDFLIEIKDGANSRLETSVLSMLDQDGNEVAGIDGTSDTDILLWGGGTHSQAKFAIDHGYYVDTTYTTKIPTLIQKNGEGKLGIFELGKDDHNIEYATVTTPDGRLIFSGQGSIQAQIKEEGASVYTTKAQLTNAYINAQKGVEYNYQEPISMLGTYIDNQSAQDSLSVLSADNVIDCILPDGHNTLKCDIVILPVLYIRFADDINKIISSSNEETSLSFIFNLVNTNDTSDIYLLWKGTYTGNTLKEAITPDDETLCLFKRSPFSFTLELDGTKKQHAYKVEAKVELKQGNQPIDQLIALNAMSTIYGGKAWSYENNTKVPHTIIGSNGLLSIYDY